MKLSAKPISSPGRTEKFPPPLMRFLRTNIGSKSHRAPTRSRSSPMFLRKKLSSSNTAIETTQEPSSPKVTCMGQVRVRKKSKKNNKNTKKKKKKEKKKEKTESTDSCRCRWISIPIPIPKLSLPVIGKWSSIFQLGFRRKENSQTQTRKIDITDSKFEEDSEDEKSKNFSEESSSYSHPIPKNALILTRCKSAPYRSSSLASRFWESPMNNDSEEKPNDERIVEEAEEKRADEESSEAPTKEKEEEKRGTEQVDLGLGLGLAILTRCKSEPARIGEKLYPEIGYWSNNSFSRGRRRRRARLGFVDYCD